MVLILARVVRLPGERNLGELIGSHFEHLLLLLLCLVVQRRRSLYTRTPRPK